MYGPIILWGIIAKCLWIQKTFLGRGEQQNRAANDIWLPTSAKTVRLIDSITGSPLLIWFPLHSFCRFCIFRSLYLWLTPEFITFDALLIDASNDSLDASYDFMSAASFGSLSAIDSLFIVSALWRVGGMKGDRSIGSISCSSAEMQTRSQIINYYIRYQSTDIIE